MDSVQEQCLRRISTVLANWQIADVRTVPGVMYQVRCGQDEFDPSIEYQVNWFLDCSETFIHNHRHSFDSYCLEGEYTEKLWEIVDDNDAKMIYQFRRNRDTSFELYKTVPGTLRIIKTRSHFPGNCLHVNTSQFHSITSTSETKTRVLTFLIKKNYVPAPDIFVHSLSPTMEVKGNQIRSTTDDERQTMFEKLQEIIINGFRS